MRVLRVLALLAITLPVAAAEESAPPADAAQTFEAVVELFRQEYWNPHHVDWDAWADLHRERVVSAGSRDAFDAALRRMVRALGDDHSAWTGLPRRSDTVALGDEAEPARLPEAPPRLGAQLQFAPGRGLVVERVFPTTPADRAGLQRGDVIVTVGGTDLAGRGGLADARSILVAALDGGPVRLAVQRRRLALVLEVEAEPVESGVVTAPYGALLDASTGYLALPSFSAAGVGEAAHAHLRDFAAAGAVNLVLDLRGNLGGRLLELGLVLGAFLDGDWAEAVARDGLAWRARYERDAAGGVARLVRDGGGVVAEARIDDPVRWRGSVVAIVGAENASAGELAALVLQDQGLARVVGEPTSGNVEAVRAFVLPDGSQVLIAVVNLQSVRGLDFEAGVLPDVVVRTSVADLARGVDPAVAEARRLLGSLPFTPDRHF